MEPNRLLSPNPMNPTRMGRPSLGSPRAAQNATAAAYNPGGTSIGRHLPLAGENTPIRGTNRHTQRGWKPKDCPFSQLHRQFVRSPVATPGTRYRRNRADTDGSPIPAPASGTLPAPGWAGIAGICPIPAITGLGGSVVGIAAPGQRSIPGSLPVLGSGLLPLWAYDSNRMMLTRCHTDPACS